MLQVRQVQVRDGIQVYQQEGIFHYLNDSVTTKSDKKELFAHQQYEEARAIGNVDEIDLFDEIVFKSNFIKSFKELISRLQLSGNETILEMGGG